MYLGPPGNNRAGESQAKLHCSIDKEGGNRVTVRVMRSERYSGTMFTMAAVTCLQSSSHLQQSCESAAIL